MMGTCRIYLIPIDPFSYLHRLGERTWFRLLSSSAILSHLVLNIKENHFIFQIVLVFVNWSFMWIKVLVKNINYLLWPRMICRLRWRIILPYNFFVETADLLRGCLILRPSLLGHLILVQRSKWLISKHPNLNCHIWSVVVAGVNLGHVSVVTIML